MQDIDLVNSGVPIASLQDSLPTTFRMCLDRATQRLSNDISGLVLTGVTDSDVSGNETKEAFHRSSDRAKILIAYDAVRLATGGPHLSRGAKKCSSNLFGNLGESVLFQFLRVAVKFADAFGEFLGRHGIFVVHPAEGVLGEAQLYLFACLSC